MLENDYDLVRQSLEKIGHTHSFEDTEGFLSSYRQKMKRAQQKCTHMWPNDTDAVYEGPHGIKICAICKKKF